MSVKTYAEPQQTCCTGPPDNCKACKEKHKNSIGTLPGFLMFQKKLNLQHKYVDSTRAGIYTDTKSKRL